MTSQSRRAFRQLSKPLAVLVAALFAGGMAAGLIAYLHRSPVLHTYVPGTSAWWQHFAIAVLAGAILGYARWRHQRRFGRHSGRLWLLAPLGKAAARRLARTMPCGNGPEPGLGRAFLALPPAALFLYGFYRAGEQVTGGLDPDSTVNAWGGPTYLGAMACHCLDAFVLMAAAAWALHHILLPDPANAAGGDTAVSRPGQYLSSPIYRSRCFVSDQTGVASGRGRRPTAPAG